MNQKQFYNTYLTITNLINHNRRGMYFLVTKESIYIILLTCNNICVLEVSGTYNELCYTYRLYSVMWNLWSCIIDEITTTRTSCNHLCSHYDVSSSPEPRWIIVLPRALLSDAGQFVVDVVLWILGVIVFA